MSFDVAVAEIKAGGVNGIFGLDQMDWGGESGAFYECWKVSPCCGAPDANAAIFCCLSWCLCGHCSACKLFANSTGDSCYIIPHCLVGAFCMPCMMAMTRYNIRKRLNVSGTLAGDFACACCCAPCNVCQLLRSTRTEEWNFIQPFAAPQLSSPNPKPFLANDASAGQESAPLASN